MRIQNIAAMIVFYGATAAHGRPESATFFSTDSQIRRTIVGDCGCGLWPYESELVEPVSIWDALILTGT
eukprot:scaffold38102_cov40-Cyclotella_meneghiniana.AAC.4